MKSLKKTLLGAGAVLTLLKIVAADPKYVEQVLYG